MLAGLLVTCVFVSSPPAAARPKAPSPADAHLAEGRRLFQAGDYPGALREIEASSREQNSDPALWFDMGVTLRMLGRDAEAMDAFQKFIGRADGAPPEQKTQAQRMISELDAKITAARPAPPAPPPPPGRTRPRTWIAGGATLALGGGTLAMGLSARSRYQTLRDGCAKVAFCTDSSVNNLDQRILFTNVLLGLTIASAAVTGAFLYLDLRSEKKEVGVAWNF